MLLPSAKIKMNRFIYHLKYTTYYRIYCLKCGWKGATYSDNWSTRLVDKKEKEKILSSRKVFGFCDNCGWELHIQSFLGFRKYFHLWWKIERLYKEWTT